MAADKQFQAACKVAIHEIDAKRRAGMGRRAAIRAVAKNRRLPRDMWPALAELYIRVTDDT